MKFLHRMSAVFLLCLLFACGNGPTGPQNDDPELRFTSLFLEVFFIFQDQLPDDPLAFESPKALYASVNEPYTEYFAPNEAEAFLDLLDTKTQGFGIVVDSTAGGFSITRVISDSPAADAGLMVGDTLISVDGVSVSGITFDTLRDRLRGEIGDMKVLQIRRGTREIQITVTIGEFFVPSVFHDSLATDVAYIQLTTFLTETGVSGGSAEEFRLALQQTTWAEHTIFDLRSNGGGEISQAIDITSEFLEAETALVKVRERVLNDDGNSGSTVTRNLVSKAAGSATGRKFVVLVNNFTASASELLVSALRSNRPDILIVGETTFGKGRGQVIASTPESGLVKVTFLTIEPLAGVSYDLSGIVPDIEISSGQDALEVAVQQIIGTLAKTGAQARRLRAIRAFHDAQAELEFTPLNISYDRAFKR